MFKAIASFTRSATFGNVVYFSLSFKLWNIHLYGCRNRIFVTQSRVANVWVQMFISLLPRDIWDIFRFLQFRKFSIVSFRRIMFSCSRWPDGRPVSLGFSIARSTERIYLTLVGRLWYWFTLEPPRYAMCYQSIISRDVIINVFFKYGPTPASFSFIFVFRQQTLQFLQQIMWKMSIQCTALGFEPTTFGTWP